MSKTTNEFDDRFYDFLLGSLPVDMIEMLKQQFIEQETGQMSFERWFYSLPSKPEMMQLLHELYHFDQLGKREKTAYKANLQILKRVPKKTNIKEMIEAFSEFMASGGLQDK